MIPAGSPPSANPPDLRTGCFPRIVDRRTHSEYGRRCRTAKCGRSGALRHGVSKAAAIGGRRPRRRRTSSSAHDKSCRHSGPRRSSDDSHSVRHRTLKPPPSHLSDFSHLLSGSRRIAPAAGATAGRSSRPAERIRKSEAETHAAPLPERPIRPPSSSETGSDSGTAPKAVRNLPDGPVQNRGDLFCRGIPVQRIGRSQRVRRIFRHRTGRPIGSIRIRNTKRSGAGCCSVLRRRVEDGFRLRFIENGRRIFSAVHDRRDDHGYGRRREDDSEYLFNHISVESRSSCCNSRSVSVSARSPTAGPAACASVPDLDGSPAASAPPSSSSIARRITLSTG